VSEFPASWRTVAFRFEPNPSFTELLRRAEAPLPIVTTSSGSVPSVPEGTTILAMVTADGVVIAGDRRATEGTTIADRRIEKVFSTDRYAAVAIAGAAGPAIEMVRLFKTEVEHYEKLEGSVLSLEGKANRLAGMIRANFPFALQGLVVVPIFAGYDQGQRAGRIFRYDAVGGRYEEAEHHATGSGGVHARSTLRHDWRPGMTTEEGIRLALEALADAAEEDTATSGPDLRRGIFPVVASITEDGYERVSDETLAPIATEILTGGR